LEGAFVEELARRMVTAQVATVVEGNLCIKLGLMARVRDIMGLQKELKP
jgi:hypothetical protein